MTRPLPHLPSALRRFLDSEASGGIILMLCAALALLAANSPFGESYRHMVESSLGGMSLEAWVNDVLMAIFFLLVGLEIKREFLHGQLRTWSARALPLLGALGGMLVPALIFAAINWTHPDSLKGWAIPSATDIAFALGVLSLLGDRVPASLKVFLTALAVLDDLGAVLIIAVFYTGGLSVPFLLAATIAFVALALMNRLGVRALWPYLLIGAVLWFAVWRSGVHATVAGVLLALTIPAEDPPSTHESSATPMQRLETALEPWVAYLILPVFAFVNAGVAFGADLLSAAANPVTLGVAFGLSLGKQSGVLASIWLAVKLRLAQAPAGASWGQVYGVALLCGIGFTMSLFIGLLAYSHSPEFLNDTKIGVLLGSVVSALAGLAVLRFAPVKQRYPRVVPGAER